jgi:outer membrane protein, heavy metal efflux system
MTDSEGRPAISPAENPGLNRPGFGILLLACACALPGCNLQPYRPQPLDPEHTASAFLAHSPDEPAVRTYLEAQGVLITEWPLNLWGLRELTLLGLYLHPDLEAARANVAVFQAAVATAAQPPVPTAKPLVEHHSSAIAGQSQGSYGMELEFTLGAPGKRDARMDQARFRAQVAEADAAGAAWKVRSRVRRQFVEIFVALGELELARQDNTARAQEAAIARQRLDAGAADSIELGQAQMRLDQAALRADQAQARLKRARVQLADALGLAPERVVGMQFDFTDLERLPDTPDAAATREAALTHRSDIRRGLSRYAEADASLKLAVASQYPDLQIKPGFLWDQGDRIWALALGIPLQLLQDQEAPVREAEARRDLEARNFVVLQARAITDTESAVAGYSTSLEQLAASRQVERSAEAQSARVERALAAGGADRNQALQARIDAIESARSRLTALAAAQSARGALEDAMEQPLEGAPAPAAENTPPLAVRDGGR